MKARLVGPSHPAWSSILGSTAHDFYHLPAYVQLEADRAGGEAAALHVSTPAAEMLLPLIVRSIDGGHVDATAPYGYGGPLVRGARQRAFVSEALWAAMPMLAANGFVSLFARLHPVLNVPVSADPATIVRHGSTVAIDLTLPADVVWQQLRRNHRDNIARSIEQGHRVTFDDWSQYDSFTDLYRQTMERVEASDDYFFDEDYFGRLPDALGEHLHLVTIEIEGSIAAGTLLVETDGIVEYHLVGVREPYLRHAPAKLTIHMATQWARHRGNRLLHLGGGVGGANDSLYRFKAGFSRTRYLFNTLRLVIDRREYRRLARIHAPDADGEDLTGYFPIYRDPSSSTLSDPIRLPPVAALR